MNDRKKIFLWLLGQFFAVHLYLLCLIDQRYRYLLYSTVSLTRFSLANPKPSTIIKLAKNKDNFKKLKKSSFYLTSGFWIFTEVKFPSHPWETESYFLSHDSGCSLTNNDTSAKLFVFVLSYLLLLCDFFPRMCFLVIQGVKDHTMSIYEHSIYFMKLCLRREKQTDD